MKVLQLSPHPDDELLGPGATLIALAQAGHEVTNLAISLGREPEQEARRQETREACRRVGMDLEVLEPPLSISVAEGDDLEAARETLLQRLRPLVAAVDLVVAPSPHEAHPAHELVGRAALDCADAARPRIWLWALWGDLALPTTITEFDLERLALIEYGLQAHESQLKRNDFTALMRARSTIGAIVGPERVFGFGSKRLDAPCAELTCELVPRDGHWMLGAPRLLDPDDPLPKPRELDATRWIDAPAARDLLT